MVSASLRESASTSRGPACLAPSVRVDAGTFDVDASLQWSGLSGVLSGSGALNARYVRLHAPALSSSTLVGAQGRLAGRFSYLPDTGTLVLDEVDFGIAPLGLRLQGAANLNPERIQLSARGGMPAHEAHARRRVADGLLLLDGLRAEAPSGSTSPSRSTATARRRRASTSRSSTRASASCTSPRARRWTSSRARSRWRSQPRWCLRAFGPTEGSWVTLSELPAHAYLAVLAAEDDAFWRHTGFDNRAIARAEPTSPSGDHPRREHVPQAVKNLFLEHERTVSRKLQEAFSRGGSSVTSPRPLLELYLNLVQWGPEVYGLADRGGLLRAAGGPARAARVGLPRGHPANPTLYAEHYVRDDIPASRVRRCRTSCAT